MVAQAEGNRTVYTRRDGTPYPPRTLNRVAERGLW
jgi:hypothetical protein